MIATNSINKPALPTINSLASIGYIRQGRVDQFITLPTNIPRKTRPYNTIDDALVIRYYNA
jgi:hypothetical protein